MNFADPQAAISTLVDLDGGFDAYSVVVAGAGLHPRARFILMREHSSQHGVGDVEGRETGPGVSRQGQVEEW
jgi:hypothetical protein